MGSLHETDDDAQSLSGALATITLPAEEGCYVEHAPTSEDLSPYTALSQETNEIRLLHVSPDETPGSFHYRLKVFSLTEAPKFTALSYTWGRPDRSCAIYLNGKRHSVRKNLMRFLKQVDAMPAHRRKWFWIDALCIDQCNVAEQSRQVELMAEIYRQAEQVMTWLGPAYGDSDLAIRAIAKFGSCDMSGRYRNIWWRSEGEAIRSLYERPYWRRQWIVQELALAQEVILLCGTRSVPWVQFEKFSSNAQHKLTRYERAGSAVFDSTIASPAVAMIKQIRLAQEGKSSLIAQMDASRHLLCADPRDKVYALLGIVEQGDQAIKPDYSIGLPTILNAVMRDDSGFRTLSHRAALQK